MPGAELLLQSKPPLLATVTSSLSVRGNDTTPHEVVVLLSLALASKLHPHAHCQLSNSLPCFGSAVGQRNDGWGRQPWDLSDNSPRWWVALKQVGRSNWHSASPTRHRTALFSLPAASFSLLLTSHRRLDTVVVRAVCTVVGTWMVRWSFQTVR